MSCSAPAKVARIGGAIKTFDEPKIVYKQAKARNERCVVVMELPVGEELVYPDRPAHSWNSDKLRASAIEVVRVEQIDGDVMDVDGAYSYNVPKFTYPVGERVEPDEFSRDTSAVSRPGIHCFATRVAAEHWGQE